MSTKLRKLAVLGTGIGWALVACVSAEAEDIEIYVGTSSVSSAKPNILFILDDSISMDSATLAHSSYDPATAYGGSCDVSRVYWSTTGGPPTCATSNYIELANFQCQRALDAFAATQGGTYRDFFAHFDPGSQNRWEKLSDLYHTRTVECQDDLPDSSSGWPGHGDGSSSTAVYPRNGNASQLWTSDPDSSARITWGTYPTGQTYEVYSGNFLNWYYGPTSTTTRLQVMKDVAVNVINSVNDINVGLMHFNNDAGGLVAHAVDNVSTGRPAIVSAINSLTADNMTPLEETLYESYLYMTAGTAHFGGSGVAEAFADPVSGIYDSPIDLSCQKNHIVLLTDGEPRSDLDASSLILGLTDAAGDSFNDLVGATCDLESYPPGFATGEGGECLDDLAEFMFEGDLSPLSGRQNVTTHTVGFHVDLPILEQTAARGGGEYRIATDTATLTNALTSIVTNIVETQTTFTAPSVSINAFNQARNLNDIYVGVFQPSSTAHWPGNLKKFRLRAADAKIVDANNEPIIDEETGMFLETVQDFWSSDIDGPTVTLGGAANQIPLARNVYTYMGVNSDLTHTTNAIDTSNGLLTDGLLGTGSAGVPTRNEVLDFINGLDASDVDQDGVLMESRNQMGDPLHSQPVVVVYGPETDDALVFMGTNDGYLHAFNVDDGSEAWSFLPQEFIGDQVQLFIDNSSASKIYGADGSIRVQTIADSDGVIEEADGEKVYLFFGMRRGGDAYYALDITDPDRPEVLWHKDSSDLLGLGQSWSSVTPTRINISGASQNTHKLALVIGGGYDASQDATSTSTDSSGNSIYIVDTVTGNLLWHGTNSGGDEDFSTTDWSMDYSIPADVSIMDLNSDGFVDRMYAADMGGQVWRFDITNGNTVSNLVTGGVIAQLGAAGVSLPTDAETRRFYYAPDVARVVTEDYNFIHIGIGSGHRAHPNATVNQDEFYALRDYWTFTPKTQAQHDAFTPVEPDDLVNVTAALAASVPQGSAGWRLSLNDGGWRGEKVLARARTFDGQIFISTYRPGTAGISCEPSVGTTRQYVVSLFNAAPVTNLDGSIDPTVLELTDRYREYQGPPPPETVFFFPGPEGDVDGDGDIDADDAAFFSFSCAASGTCLGPTPCLGLRCTVDGEVRFPVRSFWSQDFE